MMHRFRFIDISLVGRTYSKPSIWVGFKLVKIFQLWENFYSCDFFIGQYDKNKFYDISERNVCKSFSPISLIPDFHCHIKRKILKKIV